MGPPSSLYYRVRCDVGIGRLSQGKEPECRKGDGLRSGADGKHSMRLAVEEEVSEPSQLGRIWAGEVKEVTFLNKEHSFEMKAPGHERTG